MVDKALWTVEVLEKKFDFRVPWEYPTFVGCLLHITPNPLYRTNSVLPKMGLYSVTNCIGLM